MYIYGIFWECPWTSSTTSTSHFDALQIRQLHFSVCRSDQLEYCARPHSILFYLFLQNFRESFAKILALKIGFFRNFDIIFKISAKNCNFKKFDKNENIGEHSICNFSINFSGAGKLLRKEAKYCRKFHQNFRQNFGKTLWVQNFTKTATLWR